MIDQLFDRIFVISMPTSERRRAYIREHFTQIGIGNYEFLDAIVGARLDLDALKEAGILAHQPPEHGGYDLHPGEVGAAWSHIKVYEIAKDRGLERIMVCEDDIRFCPDANERIDSYLREMPSDWDIIHFQSLRAIGSKDKWDDMREQISEHIYRGANEGAGASCYALTRRCIDFLLSVAFPINKAPDGLTNWPTGWWPPCDEYTGYIVNPLPCVSGMFPSDIGDRGVDVPEVLYRRWLDR